MKKTPERSKGGLAVSGVLRSVGRLFVYLAASMLAVGLLGLVVYLIAR